MEKEPTQSLNSHHPFEKTALEKRAQDLEVMIKETRTEITRLRRDLEATITTLEALEAEEREVKSQLDQLNGDLK